MRDANSCVANGNCMQCPDGTLSDVCPTSSTDTPGAGGDGGSRPTATQPNTADGGGTGGTALDLSCDTNPTLPLCVQLLAIVPGLPTGPCQQTDGTQSLSIGATVGSVTDGSGEHIRSVVDVNQVNGINSQVIANNQKVKNNFKAVGWIYLDDGGGLWFQKDPQAQWTIAYGVNFNKYFGLALTPPPGENPVAITKPTTSPASSNIQTIKCWKQGQALVPGALGA